jgi:carbon storage regulator
MLVLSRKVGQQVILGDGSVLDVHITVLGIKGNTVRLGLTAPKEVNILRGELVGTPKASRPSEVEYVREYAVGVAAAKNGKHRADDYLDVVLEGLFQKT